MYFQRENITWKPQLGLLLFVKVFLEVWFQAHFEAKVNIFLNRAISLNKQITYLYNKIYVYSHVKRRTKKVLYLWMLDYGIELMFLSNLFLLV